MKRACILLALLIVLGCLAGCASKEPDAGTCTITVRACGENGEAVPGVIVNFCTDSACTPVTTDADGLAVFTGPADSYHVQIVRVPAGWERAGEAEWTAGPHDESCQIALTEVSA